jgi:hypothetical protein
VRRWLLLRPELYEPKLKMVTDDELLDGGFVYFDEHERAAVLAADVGDWVSIKYGIAIRLASKPVSGDDQVFE